MVSLFYTCTHFYDVFVKSHPCAHAYTSFGLFEMPCKQLEMRLKECGLTTLETRRLRGDQIEVF